MPCQGTRSRDHVITIEMRIRIILPKTSLLLIIQISFRLKPLKKTKFDVIKGIVVEVTQ